MSKVDEKKIQEAAEILLEGCSTQEDVEELSTILEALGRDAALEEIGEFIGRVDFKVKLEEATSNQLRKLTALLGDICGQE